MLRAARDHAAAKAQSTTNTNSNGDSAGIPAKTAAVSEEDLIARKEQAMAASRDGWLFRKEGKLKKKWVKIFVTLKDGTLSLATDTPDQNGAAQASHTLECSCSNDAAPL